MSSCVWLVNGCEPSKLCFCSVTCADMATKPFRPEEARRIMQFLDRPAVFLDMTANWPGRDWTLEHLALCLEEKSVRFRIGKQFEQKGKEFLNCCLINEVTYLVVHFHSDLSWNELCSFSYKIKGQIIY